MDIRYEDDVASFAAFLGDLGLDHVELRAGYLDARPGAPDVEALRAVAREHDLTYTVHAPHVDVAPGNVNDRLRAATVDAIQEATDLAAAVDAGGVVVHGGTARNRYPDRVRDQVRERAVRTIRECAEYASKEGVPLCLENQRETPTKHRHTATPERLADFLSDVGVDSVCLTLDVGHANATDVDYRRFVDRFGDRIRIAHLHDNDGTADAHEPLPSFRDVAADIGAPYNVLEMKSRDDVERCVGPTTAD
jgi:sugar phosphate isomerase/epimerase